MIAASQPCPSCGAPCALEQVPHTVRRGDRTVSVPWQQYVCGHGCQSERGDEPLAFVTEALEAENRTAAERAWLSRYGEPIPPPGRAGRPHRAGAPSTERVPVLFTREELEEIDRRRGEMSRSAYVRQATLGHR